MLHMLNVVKRPLLVGGYGVGGYGENERNFKRYKKHYEKGLSDTREFLNFYSDANNNNT